MKKVVAILLALTLVLSLCLSAMAEDVVKIGVFEPASGSNGAGGKQEILGVHTQIPFSPPWKSAEKPTRCNW